MEPHRVSSAWGVQMTARPPQGRGDLRATLVAMSSRLELLWSETRRSAGMTDWDVAGDRFVDALSALEGYAGLLEPELGRRDWRSRDPRPPPLAPAHMSMPVSTMTRS